MEIIKEIRISRDNVTMQPGTSGFQMHIPGLQDSLRLKKHVIRVKGVNMPSVWRKVEFECFYNKGSPTAGRVSKYSLNYRSINDLCNQLSIVVNYSTIEGLDSEKVEKRCSNVNRDHFKHICSNITLKKVEFSVRNDRVLIECAKNAKLIVSNNLAEILGFPEHNICTVEAIVNDRKYTEFVAGIMIGDYVSLLKDYESVCHVAMNNLNCRLVNPFGNFPIIFTFDYEKDRCEDVQLNLFKTYTCVSDRLIFNFFNDRMEPYLFGLELQKQPFSFTLLFISL